MKTILKQHRLSALCLAAAFAALLGSCEKNEPESPPSPSKRPGISFSLGMEESELATVVTRAGGERGDAIQEMYYALTSNKDGVQTFLNPWQAYLAEDYSKLTIEGLGPGDYSIIFYGSTKNGEMLKVPFQSWNDRSPKKELGHYIVRNTSNTKPLNVDCLFARVDFSVSSNLYEKRAIPVLLKRCVGRVELDIKKPESVEKINSIYFFLDLDDQSKVYLEHSDSDGEYPAKFAGINNHSLAPDDPAFYSFPSVVPLSGRVSIEYIMNKTIVKNVYRFTGLDIKEGIVIKVPITIK